MKEIATALIIDRDGRLLVYLRDDIPSIPFPNHWDLFGGHVEQGESSEEALARELNEELGMTAIGRPTFFRRYDCTTGDAFPNTKYVYWLTIPESAEELTLREGQRLAGLFRDERKSLKFANILGQVVEDFATDGPAGLWRNRAN